ncbi:MAG: ribonuclease H-like domain-containing protein [Dehalococcoidia bacterium]
MPADLRDRLRAALNQPSRVAPFPRAASVTENEDLAGLGGRWFDSPEGPGYVIESVYDAGHAHGSVVLHRALSLDMARIAPQARDERLAACDPSGLLYVDTETTGLGGAGAMVFLAGVARFEGATLHLRQYLLPSPAFERGLLGGLAGELGTAGALVSYNGKSFDLPMLEARYILSRARPTFRQLPHLDLLHPNRRLFKGAVESHRLPNIERELLGFEREDDCPSAEVPERYFRFARTSDPTHILPVLRHNAWDILSLVALTAHLGAACDVEQFPLQASRAAGYAGDLESVVRFAEATLASSPGRAARIETIERAARACRRLGRNQEAAEWWRRAIDEPRARRLTPYIELSKLYEHRLHDPAAALNTIETAISLVQRGILPQGNPTSEATLAALQRRRDRLEVRATHRSP